MSDVHVKLQADKVEEFLELKIRYYNEHWKIAKEEAYSFMANRLKKTWFGLIKRPFTDKERSDLVSLHFGWASTYYTNRLDRIAERAKWSKTNNGGFNEVYLSTYEFQDYITNPSDQIEEYEDRFRLVIRNMSVLADVI